MITSGYKTDFIDPDNGKLRVDLPELSDAQLEDLAPVGDDEGLLHYVHFSLKLSSTRRFPFFTATNIDGGRFKKVKRAEVFPSGHDEWREDDKAGEYQWGQKLYDAPRSYFDRGHMSKREDPQWGPNLEFARKAAQSTFHFTNCVPQLLELNQRIWQSLETYILTRQSVPNKLRICLFTGPMLAETDPYFVTEVKGERVQLPVLFWKVVYYTNDGKILSRAAFLMGQEDLLLERGIATHDVGAMMIRAQVVDEGFFMDYEDAETYQVNVETIEKLTKLTFPKAKEAYEDSRPIKLIKEAVQATAGVQMISENITPDASILNFAITNIQL